MSAQDEPDDPLAVREEYFEKIKTLSENLWERRAERPAVEEWLANFSIDWDTTPSEQLHALFLLSHFMYFGDREIRVLLRALYRDLYRYPIIEAIRRDNGDTTDSPTVTAAFDEELARTRFLGLGNPAESGTHLLYYFRQENELPKGLFVHTHQVFGGRLDSADLRVSVPEVTRYVLLDDFCGSGNQAVEYSEKVIGMLRDAATREGLRVEIAYYVLFATYEGLRRVREDSDFDRVEAVYELDETYKLFGDTSRYLRTHPGEINRDFAHQMCTRCGERLYPDFPLGYGDCELLIGFHHNTPDNTLPIFWVDGEEGGWSPMFRRYAKVEQ